MVERTDKKQIKSFYFRLIIPGILTITAFIFSSYFIFIPALEKNMLNQKKEMIRELTNSAWSILENYHDRFEAGDLKIEQARKDAIELIQMLRYGKESKDYFWVTDMSPKMIAHPYRPDLNGLSVENYRDPNGKKLFVESVSLVEAEGEGYINYFWQWMDDSSRIVPKISFVKGFSPWGWVVGTGIYLEDIQEEIKKLEKNLILASILIIIFVSLTLIFILRTGLLLENKRQKAVSDLADSRERYRSLVEASEEGTIMSMDSKITYVNPYFLNLFGYTIEDLLGKDPAVLFDQDDQETIETFNEFMNQDKGVIQLETKLVGKEGMKNNVLVTVSRMKIGNKKAGIFITKELSASSNMAQQIDELGEELQTSLLFMNQPVHLISRNPLACFMNTTIQSCAEAMSRADQNGILIRGSKGEFMGIVTDYDLRHRVLARGVDFKEPVYSIMSSPVISIADNALLFEALLCLQQNNVTHVAVKDPIGNLTGLISYEELLQMQQNTTAYLMRQIEMADHSDDLIQYSRKTKGIVRVLEQSGAKTRNITRIITTVTDALTRRFVELALLETEAPSAAFVFIALGSEGRGEQSLSTDQDNGIIYEHNSPEKREEIQNYFLSIGQKVNDWLNQAGYNYCMGDVMAGNPMWCKPLSEWKNTFKKWIFDAQSQAVLEASIFFDFRPVSGDFSLCDELQKYVDSTVRNQSQFFYQMADQTLKFKSSTDLNSHYILNKATGKKVFDSKKILFPITSFARIYAIHHNIKMRSTLARLNNLNQIGKLSNDLYNRISEGYDFLMMIRFKAQLLAIERNQEVSNEVPVELLSDMEQIYLRKVMSTLAEIQTKVKLDFRIS